jgi:AbrB family looped-hinge helix DNA binding protein
MPEDVEIVVAHQVKKDGTLAAVIPKTIRDSLGISKGTKLIVYGSRGRVVMRPLDQMLRGIKASKGDSAA